ncbi:MAG: outer membrane beta-barrel protein [Prevotella sp.]
MKKLLSTLLLALMTLVTATAQNRTVKGVLVDRDTKELLPYMTVQLLKPDSTFIGGMTTKEDGTFSVQAPSNGKYLIRFTGVGYNKTVKQVEITGNQDIDMGKIVMNGETVMLKGAVVTGQALKVTMKEDTFVYNSSAYRTPEGSTIEELVKRLPGAQIDDDGKITINGKEVKKILVEGKEFFTDDTNTALKNLPTSIVQTVKAYDEKSDLTKVTGIDDGNESTVLDFGLKKGMNKGMFSNLDFGIGTHDRYAEKLMAAYFKGNWRVMAFGNFNNVNDMGFGGRGGMFGRNRTGLNASKMTGINLNYEEKGKLKINGSVRWNHRDNDTRSNTSTENYISSVGAFSNSLSQSYTRENRWNARFRIEWNPDTLTNILFRPRVRWTKTDGLTTSQSASYNEDPYNYTDYPLSEEGLQLLDEDSLMVNLRKQMSMSYSETKMIGGRLQINRKLSSTGRNITLLSEASYTDTKNTALSTNNVHLFQVLNALGQDSTYQTNRYNLTPTKNFDISAELTYSEPLWKATFLQFIYGFDYSYNKSDRSTYDFSNLGEDFFSSIDPKYRTWDNYLNLLPNSLESYYDQSLSRFAQYRTYSHDLELMFRMVRAKYNFNVGIMVNPQMTKFVQDYQGVKVDTVRHVTNFTPTLDFRYRFSKESNLRINYRGTTTQPSMTDLLDITDDSDPLNVTKGNPGLKPSFTQTLRFFYNNNNVTHYQQVWASWLNFSTTRNSISNMVTYDEQTGGRTTQPQNINGQWSLNGGLMFNTALDSAGYWNVNTNTMLGYQNYVGYVNLDQSATAQKNNTRDFTVSERLAGSYRNDWLEVELDGSLNYRHSRNDLQSTSNSDVWQFAYGINLNLQAPWGTTLVTDLHENSRRGYSDASLNTNELIWNVQLSQSFLKGKPLTLSLQFYDILNEQSNFSRAITAMQRSDTEYNAINSYVMFHAIYRLNIFGGKEAREQMQPPHRPDFNRRDMRGPGGMPPGGRRGGHFGGFGSPM